MRRKQVFGGLVVFGFVTLVAHASSVVAYDRYSQNRDATNCAACHGDFNSGSYVSLHDHVAWGTDLMAGHNAMMSSDCSACHQSSSHFPVLTNSSAGGSKGFSTSGCVGCHGRVGDAGHGASDGRGAGLRQHHDRSGITECRACHADADTTTPTYTPVTENMSPINYFVPDANHPNKPTDPCDANGTESYYGSAGLDNDGNGLYDGADPACRPPTTTLPPTTTTVSGATTTTSLAAVTTTTASAATTTAPSSTTTIPDSDVDDDGIPDANDPCNNSGAHDITIKPKVIVKRLDAAGNDDALLVKGEFVSASPFSNLDGQGLRVVGLRKDGTAAFDIPISGDVSVGSNKILFTDDAGSNNGITKFQIIDRSNKAPNQVKILVKGKDGSYPIGRGDEPIRLIVVIGDGSVGECGETAFGTDACTFNGSGNTLKCR